MVSKQFKQNIRILYLSEVYCVRQQTLPFACIKTWYDGTCNWNLHFDTCLIYLELYSSSQSFQLIQMEVCILLRLLVLWTSYSFYVIYLIFKRKNPTPMISFRNLWCLLVFRHLHLQTDFFFRLGMMIETTKLYILISGSMTLIFIQGHSCMRN